MMGRHYAETPPIDDYGGCWDNIPEDDDRLEPEEIEERNRLEQEWWRNI